tara:strand:- start:6133 stop:7260 length:1128 start_codon:yes stop_codon:yes gene_type:complete
MDKFNENLKQFLEIIKVNYPDQKNTIEKHYNFDDPKDIYLNEFIKNCSIIGDDISTKNEIIFSKEITVLNNVDFNSIWNDESLTDDQRENIWKYLHTLYIFAYEHIKNVDFKTVLKEIKNIGNSGNMDNETKTFINIIESLTDKYKNMNTDDLDESMDNDNNDDNKQNSSGIPTPEMFGGVIGNLAKEIADEIDPNSINLEDPSKLLKSLLSGNFDEDNDESGLVHLVKNITNKIQDKISTGNLDESQLFNEAQNVMKSFQKNTKGGVGDPMNMFSSMMQSGMMDNLDEEGSNIVDQAANIIKNKGMGGNITPGKLQSQAQLKSTRDRLRKKLEKKKQLLEKKKTKGKNNNTNEIPIKNEDIDLDALADEIEGLK